MSASGTLPAPNPTPDFAALSFREKLEVIEGLGELAALLIERRRRRGLPVIERGSPVKQTPVP